jgi:hypothetical protein
MPCVLKTGYRNTGIGCRQTGLWAKAGSSWNDAAALCSVWFMLRSYRLVEARSRPVLSDLRTRTMVSSKPCRTTSRRPDAARSSGAIRPIWKGKRHGPLTRLWKSVPPSGAEVTVVSKSQVATLGFVTGNKVDGEYSPFRAESTITPQSAKARRTYLTDLATASLSPSNSLTRL